MRQFFLLIPSMRMGVLFCIIVLFSGCVPHYNAQGISILASLSQSQADMNRYVIRERKGFQRLWEDIAHEKLHTGTFEAEIISRYGQPVFCRQDDDPAAGKKCLYRRPFGFFDSDSAYLYYDRDKTLSHWKLRRSRHPE